MRWLLPTALAIAWVAPTSFAAEPSAPAESGLKRFEFHEKHMAVDFLVVLYAPDEATAKRAAAAAYARIQEVDERMSDYAPQSELNRLSDTAPSPQPVPLSEDLFRVLARSQELSELSDGAFDCTIGAVVKLWRRARRTGEAPSNDLLTAARKTCGYKSLELDKTAHTAKLLKPGTRLDLGAIAKGYGSDAGLAAMKKLGVTRALVAGSGDMAIGDPPPGKRGWRIGVAPLDAVSPATRHLLVANCGVSTSGDEMQHVKIGGKQYSHVINPLTGMALSVHSCSTTVAPDGMTSDALATAVGVMGPKAGLAMIEKMPGAAALVVEKPADREEVYESKRFAEFEDDK